jgi:tetratricopeptide (TPR) repeat protein
MKKSGLWLLAPLALMMVSAPVLAAEPSVRDVYATARAGQVDKAVTMMDEVLKAHPNSAKAHYVQAELMAKQGRIADARTQLAAAEKLAPGLPGIQPQSVAALKAQLNGGSVGNGAVTTTEAPRPAQSRGISWVGIVLIGALVFGVLAFFRRRSRQAEAYNASMGGGITPMPARWAMARRVARFRWSRFWWSGLRRLSSAAGRRHGFVDPWRSGHGRGGRCGFCRG